MRVTGHSGFGIKKRYWFGGRSRPPFMEPGVVGVPPGVPLGVPPPHDGVRLAVLGRGALGVPLGVPPPHDGFGLGVPLGVPPPHDGYKRHLRSSSSFPLKDDAGYIGYLSDDDDIMSVVRRRRRELLGPDISFTMCCLLMVMVMMVVMMVVWGFRWGFRPPATGNYVLGVPPPNGGNYVR
jgi:hypothetical protein